MCLVHWGSLQLSPRPPSWIGAGREGSGKGEEEGERGEGEKGKREGEEGKGRTPNV